MGGGGGGGGGGGHPDPGLRGMPSLEKKFFRPFGPQFDLKIREGGPPVHPLLRLYGVAVLTALPV